jgi:hypothetical protein
MHPALANIYDALTRLQAALDEAEPHVEAFGRDEVLSLWQQIDSKVPSAWVARASSPALIHKS